MLHLVTYNLHKWTTRFAVPLNCGGLALELPTHTRTEHS